MPITIDNQTYLRRSEAVQYLKVARGIDVSIITFLEALKYYQIPLQTLPNQGTVLFVKIQDLGNIPAS